MSPFSRDRVGADEDLSLDGDAAPDTGAENDPEYGIDPGSRAIGGLRQGKAIRVVGQARRPPERGLDIALQGAPDQPGGIGVFDEAGFRGDSAGNTNPDRSRCANFLLDAADESNDRVDRCAIVLHRRRNSAADADQPQDVDGGGLDFGAAEVDADAEPC
jgi:hypothetical protein